MHKYGLIILLFLLLLFVCHICVMTETEKNHDRFIQWICQFWYPLDSGSKWGAVHILKIWLRWSVFFGGSKVFNEFIGFIQFLFVTKLTTQLKTSELLIRHFKSIPCDENKKYWENEKNVWFAYYEKGRAWGKKEMLIKTVFKLWEFIMTLNQDSFFHLKILNVTK